jgi:hypothetical protein
VISPCNNVRLYSLPRLVELVAASELRHQGVSLQHIGESSTTYGNRATSRRYERCASRCQESGCCSSTTTARGRTRVAPSRE